MICSGASPAHESRRLGNAAASGSSTKPARAYRSARNVEFSRTWASIRNAGSGAPNASTSREPATQESKIWNAGSRMPTAQSRRSRLPDQDHERRCPSTSSRVRSQFKDGSLHGTPGLENRGSETPDKDCRFVNSAGSRIHSPHERCYLKNIGPQELRRLFIPPHAGRRTKNAVP
jgi:hypothetical protein